MEHHPRILARYVADWIPGVNLLQWVHKDVVCHTSSSLKCTILHTCLLFHSQVQPSLHTTTSPHLLLPEWRAVIFLNYSSRCFIVFRMRVSFLSPLMLNMLSPRFLAATDPGISIPCHLCLSLFPRVLMKHILTTGSSHSDEEWKTVVVVTYFVEATDQGLCLLNHSSFHSPLNHSLDVLFFVLFCHCCICPSRFQLSLCHLENQDEWWGNNVWITLCFKFKGTLKT